MTANEQIRALFTLTTGASVSLHAPADRAPPGRYIAAIQPVSRSFQQRIDRDTFLLEDLPEFLQRIHLDLAHTFAGNPDFLADLFQG